jgi:DNA repair protein RadA/Sms
VFVNAVGDVRILEPGGLGVLTEISFSMKNRPLPAKSIVFGEVVRRGRSVPSQRGLERIREAAKLEFTTILVPSANKPKQGVDGVRVIPVYRVDEALAALRC